MGLWDYGIIDTFTEYYNDYDHIISNGDNEMSEEFKNIYHLIDNLIENIDVSVNKSHYGKGNEGYYFDLDPNDKLIELNNLSGNKICGYIKCLHGIIATLVSDGVNVDELFAMFDYEVFDYENEKDIAKYNVFIEIVRRIFISNLDRLENSDEYEEIKKILGDDLKIFLEQCMNNLKINYKSEINNLIKLMISAMIRILK